MFRDFDHWKKYAESPLFRALSAGYQKASGGNTVVAITYYGNRQTTANKALNRPEDIAHAAVFLASDEAAMITGSCLEVDGGRCI